MTFQSFAGAYKAKDFVKSSNLAKNENKSLFNSIVTPIFHIAALMIQYACSKLRKKFFCSNVAKSILNNVYTNEN